MEEQNLNLSNSTNKSFPFFRILYRNLTLIIIMVSTFVVLGTVYGVFMVKPVYTAKCDAIFYIVLQDSSSSVQRGTTSLAKSSLPTFSDFIKSPIVEATARKNSNNNSISRGAVSVDYYSDNLIISISYTSATPEDAKEKLDAYIDAASSEFEAKPPIENAKRISLVKLQNEYIVRESKGGSDYFFLGLVIGLVLGVTISVLRYLLDNKLKDKDELEELTGVSLLSYIDKQ